MSRLFNSIGMVILHTSKGKSVSVTYWLTVEPITTRGCPEGWAGE